MSDDKTVEPARAGAITAEQAARLLMLSDERVRQLAAEGYIPKASRNVYPLVGTVQGYIRFLTDESRRAARGKAAIDLINARRTEIELKIAREEAKLIPREEAVAFTKAVADMLVSGLERLPERGALGAIDRAKFDAAVAEIRAETARAIARHPMARAEQ